MAQAIEEAIGLVGELLERRVDRNEALVIGLNENRRMPVRAGEGVGAIEAPRGILFHSYRTNEAGLIVEPDCLIPTNQNLANIEEDLAPRYPASCTRATWRSQSASRWWCAPATPAAPAHAPPSPIAYSLTHGGIGLCAPLRRFGSLKC